MTNNSNSKGYSISNELNEILQENPWLSAAEDFTKGPNADGMYIVEKDKEVLKPLRNNKPDLYRRFRFDILPDPLVGNVCAPVIVLCLNPGYSALDKYNYESVDDQTKHLVQCEYQQKMGKVNAKRRGKGKEPVHREIRFLFSGEDEKVQLNRRRQLMIESLRLIPGNEPYGLDPSFNSAEIINSSTKQRDACANTRFGTYNWHRFLFGIGENGIPRFPTKNVFHMEYFPYHSEHLSTNDIDLLERDYPMAHSAFRNSFLRLRLKEGAYILARTRRLRELLITQFENYRAQIGCFSSDQTASLSEKNIISGSENERQNNTFKETVLSLLRQ